MLTIDDCERHTAEYHLECKQRLAQYGLQIYRISNHSVHNMPAVTLNLPDRDEKVAEFIRFICNLGAAGIHYNTYAHMANGIWSSGRTHGRAGVSARLLDIENATRKWIDQTFDRLH